MFVKSFSSSAETTTGMEVMMVVVGVLAAAGIGGPLLVHTCLHLLTLFLQRFINIRGYKWYHWILHFPIGQFWKGLKVLLELCISSNCHSVSSFCGDSMNKQKLNLGEFRAAAPVWCCQLEIECFFRNHFAETFLLVPAEVSVLNLKG